MAGDLQLWERIRSGDAEAFGDLYERHARAVQSYCLWRSPNDCGASTTAGWITCPPGPAGNLLAIAGNDNVQIRREGDLVLVGTSAGNGPRDFEPIPCGQEATVTNIDRIVYRGTKVAPRIEHQFLLDEREGSLGPGASPEAVDPEIEVEVELPPQPQARPPTPT